MNKLTDFQKVKFVGKFHPQVYGHYIGGAKSIFWCFEIFQDRHSLVLPCTTMIISHICSCKWSCGYQNICIRDKFRSFQYLLIPSTESDFWKHQHNILQSPMFKRSKFSLRFSAKKIIWTTSNSGFYSQQISLWLTEIWGQNNFKLQYLQLVYQILLRTNPGNPLRIGLPVGGVGYR